MEWLLPIIGWVLNLFLPAGSVDRYWQGIAHGAAIVVCTRRWDKNQLLYSVAAAFAVRPRQWH